MDRQHLKMEVDRLLILVSYLIGTVAGLLGSMVLLLLASIFIDIPFAISCLLQLASGVACALIHSRRTD